MEQIKERPTRQRRTNQQILQLLEEFEKSKSTVIDFCRQQSISTGNFHKWKSRYRSKAVRTNIQALPPLILLPVHKAGHPYYLLK